MKIRIIRQTDKDSTRGITMLEHIKGLVGLVYLRLLDVLDWLVPSDPAGRVLDDLIRYERA